ncbi:hypothetical protein QVD17_11854 [Tagetes erecta]|uniref:TF-B3 domain-containing protein n=1 Tax=Tagetes erecta TaxID=13708 RepID=A0AAD8L1I4_TARER|nr:hypothetical protein QVD17_11854 [Tagetes erecta]
MKAPSHFFKFIPPASNSHLQSIPKKFALANGLSGGEMVFMNVDNEGSWTVKLRNEFGKHFCIQRGLREFCTGIGLQKGESFRFELIHNGKKPAAVNIPLAFARSNKLNMRNCEVCLKDENQRLWPAQLCDSGGHVRIFGLRGMMIANELKEGDDFILELLDNGDKPFMNFHRNGNEVATNAFV